MADQMENYQKAMDERKNTRKAQPGDVVHAMGIDSTIATIYYQDFYKSDRNDGTCDWDIEFVDTNGNYRHWKQYFDKGHIDLK